MVTEHISSLVSAARHALKLTQQELALELGSSKRTVARWEAVEATPEPAHLEKLARLLHPVDRGLASRVAAQLGKSLAQLGLEAPPVVAAPAPVATPSLEHLADSLVCAAAEASGATPQVTRAALLAAFERARVMGLSVDKACEGLRAARPAP